MTEKTRQGRYIPESELQEHTKLCDALWELKSKDYKERAEDRCGRVYFCDGVWAATGDLWRDEDDQTSAYRRIVGNLQECLHRAEGDRNLQECFRDWWIQRCKDAQAALSAEIGRRLGAECRVAEVEARALSLSIFFCSDHGDYLTGKTDRQHGLCFPCEVERVSARLAEVEAALAQRDAAIKTISESLGRMLAMVAATP